MAKNKLKTYYRRWVIKEILSNSNVNINPKSLRRLKNKDLEIKYLELTGNSAKSSFDNFQKKNDTPCKEDGFIYLIGNLKYGFVKIGFSKNPKKRLKTIQTGCPFPLTILKTFSGTLKKEYLIHKKYQRYRTFGEWYRIQGHLKNVIESKIKQ